MFENKKVVVSGSLKFSKDIENIVLALKESGNEVLDFARSDGRAYKQVLIDFYSSIDNTDILIVANKDKNGIKGYIGNSVFSEINYAVLNNTMRSKNIDIYLLNDIDKNNTCYDEIKYFLDNNMIKILGELDKEKLCV